MKRFVTYLYEYTGAMKGKNTGFAKVDLRGDNCRMEIHVRNLNGYTGNGTVFLIIMDSGLTGVVVGEMAINRGQGDYGTICKINPIGETNYDFEQIAGVGVQYDGEKMIASKWKEDPNLILSMKDIHMWQPPQLEEMPQERQKSNQINEASKQRNTTQQTSDNVERQKEDIIAQIQQAVAQQTKRENEEEQKIQQKQVFGNAKNKNIEECPELQSRTQNVFPEDNWDGKWEEMKSKSERIPFRKEQRGSWIKIDVKGIRDLPKRNWYLGNNSFLLHGFFNYHYLLLGTEQVDGKTRWYLGIPGFYQQQERVMATIFGFPEFFPATGTEQFGYWIHTLEI